jgi:hypothetical protein
MGTKHIWNWNSIYNQFKCIYQCHLLNFYIMSCFIFLWLEINSFSENTKFKKIFLCAITYEKNEFIINFININTQLNQIQISFTGRFSVLTEENTNLIRTLNILYLIWLFMSRKIIIFKYWSIEEYFPPVFLSSPLLNSLWLVLCEINCNKLLLIMKL